MCWDLSTPLIYPIINLDRQEAWDGLFGDMSGEMCERDEEKRNRRTKAFSLVKQLTVRPGTVTKLYWNHLAIALCRPLDTGDIDQPPSPTSVTPNTAPTFD